MSDWTSPSLPLYRYDQCAFKASHNSYEREERPVTKHFAWDPAEPHSCGCRGIELDIQQAKDATGRWSVNHDGGYTDAADKQFETFLRLLDRESGARAHHDVIMVTVDLKSVSSPARDFGSHLDDYIAAHFAQKRLFTPADLAKQFAKDDAASHPRSWPLLREMKGRFVLCLSGKESWKKAYRASGKLCFTDKNAKRRTDVAGCGDVSNVYNLNWDAWGGYLTHRNRPVRERWIAALRSLAGDQRVVTRAYGLNGRDEWKQARRAGINILSTDRVRRHKWARVGDEGPFASKLFELEA